MIGGSSFCFEVEFSEPIKCKLRFTEKQIEMVYTIEHILGNQLLNQINKFDSLSAKKSHENNTNFQAYLVLLDVFIDGIEDNLLDLKQEEAKNLIPFVKRKQEYLKKNIEVYKKRKKPDVVEKLYVSYKKVAQITQDLHNLASIEVDEDSEDYANFLSFLAEESIKSPVIKSGTVLRDILPSD
ncbi:MAG: hypothetical protein AB8B69_15765 [Chitinophagales bacterium]